jgi:hypothetical protein
MLEPPLADSLASAGRALIESRYSFSRMVSSMEGIYHDELIRRAPERAVQSRLASL